MRKLIVSEFVTVDGVMEDPGGAEGFERGGWAFEFDRGPEGDKFKLDEVMQSEALLLGRKTDQIFAASWPSRTGDFADKMNSMQKYAVSSSLKNPAWNHTALIPGDAAVEVARLKAGPGGDILVAGSGQLVQALAAHDLVDEYRLMIFPVLLGCGNACLWITFQNARCGWWKPDRSVLVF